MRAAFSAWPSGMFARRANSRTARRAADLTVEVEPVAIVMDYMMPGLDGSEVVQQIRAALPAGAPPVVLVTGLPNARELAGHCWALATME